MRKAFALSLLAATLAGGALAAPATAADTTASVTVGAGGLSIAVSATNVTLASSGVTSILPSATVTGSLGTTTVEDTRGTSTGWTANISATNFVSGSNSIAIGNATVTSGAVSGTSLPALCGVGGVVTFPVGALTLSTTATQLAKCAHAVPTTVIGASKVEWANTMSLVVPATAASGTYTSTVTQSVQ